MDKYEIIKHIGRGSFGEVHTAKRKADGKVVVLKSISRVKDRQYNSAKSEIAIMKELDHPNIVKLYDDFMNEDKVVLCMEYVPGGDLQKLIVSHKNAGTRIDEAKIWQYLTEIALGLAYMHSKHMLHRDIKPENVLLTESGTSKLTDFGAGKIIEAGKMTETTIGTDFYLSPEVIGFQPYNEETDIWSLGVTIYELAALKRPYVGDNKFCILRLIKEARPKPLPDVYSQELSALIDLMLVEDPAKRISAAGILRHPRVVRERKALALRRLGYLVDPSSQTREEEERVLEMVATPLADGKDVFETLNYVIPKVALMMKEIKSESSSSSSAMAVENESVVEMLKKEIDEKNNEIGLLKEELGNRDKEIELLKQEIENIKGMNIDDNDNNDNNGDDIDNVDNEDDNDIVEDNDNNDDDKDNINIKINGFKIADEDIIENDTNNNTGNKYRINEDDDEEISLNVHYQQHQQQYQPFISTSDEMEEVSIPIGGLKTQPIDPDESLLEILTNSGSNNTINKHPAADESITGKKSWNHQKRAIIGNCPSTPKKKMASPSPMTSPTSSSSSDRPAAVSAEYLGLVPPLKPGSFVPALFVWKKHEIVKTKSTGHRAKTVWDNKNAYKLEKPQPTLMVLLRSLQQVKVKSLYVRLLTSSGMEKVTVSDKELVQLTGAGEAAATWTACNVSCGFPVVEFRLMVDDPLGVEEVVVINGATKGLDNSGSRGKPPVISFSSTAPSSLFASPPLGSKKKVDKK